MGHGYCLGGEPLHDIPAVRTANHPPLISVAARSRGLSASAVHQLLTLVSLQDGQARQCQLVLFLSLQRVHTLLFTFLQLCDCHTLASFKEDLFFYSHI
jgi:hypothetical protein